MNSPGSTPWISWPSLARRPAPRMMGCEIPSAKSERLLTRMPEASAFGKRRQRQLVGDFRTVGAGRFLLRRRHRVERLLVFWRKGRGSRPPRRPVRPRPIRRDRCGRCRRARWPATAPCCHAGRRAERFPGRSPVRPSLVKARGRETGDARPVGRAAGIAIGKLRSRVRRARRVRRPGLPTGGRAGFGSTGSQPRPPNTRVGISSASSVPGRVRLRAEAGQPVARRRLRSCACECPDGSPR